MKIQDVKVKKSKKVKEAINPALSFERKEPLKKSRKSKPVKENLNPVQQSILENWQEFKQTEPALKPIPKRRKINETNLKRRSFMKGLGGVAAGAALGHLYTKDQQQSEFNDNVEQAEFFIDRAQQALSAQDIKTACRYMSRAADAYDNAGMSDYSKPLRQMAMDCMRKSGMSTGQGMMEVKQRLDAHCWKGKHKEGTKIKGGVRVNNCVPNESVEEAWSEKYKRSINCSHPKGFSQRAHCAGRKKHNESAEPDHVCPDCGFSEQGLLEAKKGLYYYVNKRKKAGTSRPKGHPLAPSAQDWKDAAKTAKKESVEEDAIDDRLTAQYNTPAMKAQGQAVDKAFASGDQEEFDRLGILSPQQLERDYQAMLAKEPAQDAAVYADPKLTPSARKLSSQKYNPRGVPVKEGAPNFKSKQEVINYFVSKGKSAASGAAAWERGWRGPKQQKSFKSTKSLPKQHYWWQDRDLDEDTVTKNPSGTYTVSNAKKWNPDPETGTLSGSKRNIPGAIWDLAKQGMGFKSRYNTADIEADPRMKRHVKRYNDDDWIVIDPASNAFVSAAPRGTTHHRDLTLATAGTKPDYAKIPGIPLPPSLSPAFGGQPYVAIPGHVANFRRIAEDQDVSNAAETPYVVYVSNKPVGKFDTPEEAKRAAEAIHMKMPRVYIDIRKTQCTDVLLKTIAENENLYF